jgi:hypothetical protein
MSTAFDEGHSGQYLESAGPGFNNWIGTPNPVPVGLANENRDTAEGMAPFDLSALDMWVACGDGGDSAKFANAGDCRIIEETGWVPQKVSGLRSNQ